MHVTVSIFRRKLTSPRNAFAKFKNIADVP